MAPRPLYKFVRRYTTLSSALQTLRQEKLVLLNPSSWDDSNDTFFMDMYRRKLPERAVRALCCTMAKETYHHWKVFTSGIEGICIEFAREPLESAINQRAGFSAKPVEYLQVKQLAQLSAEDLYRIPFIKREAYADEKEWRIIAECNEHPQFVDFPIDLKWINSITFNPWMPPSLADNLREIIRSVAPGLRCPLRASSLTNSRAWKEAGRAILAPKA